jgi:F0F1-type ATP synthase delta subunit
MKISQLKSLIKESVKEVLNENYRDPEDNLDVLIKLLNKKKVASAIELIQSVQSKLEDNSLENAFDEAVEEFFDDGSRGMFNNTMRPEY